MQTPLIRIGRRAFTITCGGPEWDVSPRGFHIDRRPNGNWYVRLERWGYFVELTRYGGVALT